MALLPCFHPGCIQVAGIRDRKEAAMLVAQKVPMLGFPFGLPVHAEDSTRGEARMIIAGLPSSVLPVLITYLSSAVSILRLCDELGTRGIQLHGPIAPDEMRRIRQERPDLLLLKSLIIREGEERNLLESVSIFSDSVDGFLTDSFDAETGASGATGQVHDWTISRMLVSRSPKPVILAGGLTPENVSRAIREVKPFGVDVHTGVEDGEGRKDVSLVAEFMKRSRETFACLAQNPG